MPAPSARRGEHAAVRGGDVRAGAIRQLRTISCAGPRVRDGLVSVRAQRLVAPQPGDAKWTCSAPREPHRYSTNSVRSGDLAAALMRPTGSRSRCTFRGARKDRYMAQRAPAVKAGGGSRPRSREPPGGAARRTRVRAVGARTVRASGPVVAPTRRRPVTLTAPTVAVSGRRWMAETTGGGMWSPVRGRAHPPREQRRTGCLGPRQESGRS